MTLLKELILSVMLRFCDKFCAMLPETLAISTSSVIRNVVSKNLKGYDTTDLKTSSEVRF